MPAGFVVLRLGLLSGILLSLPMSSVKGKDTALDGVRTRLQAAESTRIVCFGDSITGAYYHTGSRRSWCEVLGVALREALPGSRPRMINAGVSGHTTVQALERLERDVLRHRPHLVVVMFGMNDVTRVPLDTYRRNLRSIVEQCRQAEAAVVLCTPNAVVENAARPNARLAEYAQAVLELAQEAKIECVDVRAGWEAARTADPRDWSLWMSDDIHPNMNGHRRIAEWVASRIAGREVRMESLSPPADTLQHTWQRLSRGEPVHIVAMQPYGRQMADILRREFPSARIRLTDWPISGQSLAQIHAWASTIRGLQPDLVIPAVPLDAPAPDDASFRHDYEWSLNGAFPFGGNAWDVVPVLPLAEDDEQISRRKNIARALIEGKDVAYFNSRTDSLEALSTSLTNWVQTYARRTEFRCHFRDAPIVIDGQADEEAWRQAETIAGFYLPWYGAAAPLAQKETQTRLLWDREYLYFAADLDDHDLFADIREHDGNLWHNDVFELFFKPAADKSGYFEFQVNAAGAVFDMFVPARGGDIAQMRKADPFHVDVRVVRRGTLEQRDDVDQGWSVEGRIPWTDFLPAGGRPQVDERWSFALCRYDYDARRNQPELSTCAPLNTLDFPSFHQHEGYATLQFVGPQVPTSSASPLAALRENVARVPSRVVGSPEPPPPYRAARVWPEQKLTFPIFAIREPDSRRLLVIDQKSSYGAARLCRTTETPQDGQLDVLFEFPDQGVGYSLAFHPRFSENGYLYVGWNGAGDDGKKWSRVTRYTMGRQPPCAIDTTSARTIIEWPSDGHNGAAVAFGKDGMLYVTSGDGTSDSDTNLTGQGLDHLLAKVLRIDVDRTDGDRPYSIPDDNPFVNRPGVRGETYAYGLRNPWRIAVDAVTGDVWVGNNGQDLWEQAYRLEPGANYGWSVMEGSHNFYANRALGPTPPVKPTLEHPHSEARSLTGGIVYYGRRYEELRGAYIYGDYSTGKIWGAKYQDGRVIWHRELADTTLQISAFLEDADGELLIVDHRGDGGGGFYALEPNTSSWRPEDFPVTLTATGLFASVPEHRLHAGAIPYDVNAPLWSDGAHKARYLILPADAERPDHVQPIDFTLNRGWNFPDRAAIVKSFALEQRSGDPASRRWIETRILLKQEGEWQGFTYRWNDEQTEATLVESSGRDESFAREGQPALDWHYPGRTECMVCHSRAANFILGLSTLQMNRDFHYGDVVANQLEVLEWLGALQVNWLAEAQPAWRAAESKSGQTDDQVQAAWRRATGYREQRRPTASRLLYGSPDSYPRLVDPYDSAGDLTARARSYLHSNCAQCHVGAGGGNSQIDLEFSTPLDKTNFVDVKPLHHSFDLTDARLVAPAAPDRSVLVHRMAIRSAGQMPQLATKVVDEQAVELLRAWIRSLPTD